MIRKQDIIERAAEWHLRPDIVEKDYVLGWVLAAIAGSPQLRDTWIFKGGTCLKKCYFETYRFSEDLDFSLLPNASYTPEALLEQLRELVARAHEMSGIELPPAEVRVDAKRNKQGQATFQARIAYRGPMGTPNLPRLLLDITQHEPVIDAPTRRHVHHAYPDAFSEDTTVAAYSIEELCAEKTRALYERTRPRDLYDVVQLIENYADAIDLPRARDLFLDKCKSKGLKVPTGAELIALVRNFAELEAEWKNMLGHQLPALPPLDAILVRSGAFLIWIDEPSPDSIVGGEQAVEELRPSDELPSIRAKEGEEVVAPAGVRFWGTAPLELVRFAGANRLMIDCYYDGKSRHVEPYSLRRASAGNLLLYVRESGDSFPKSFIVSKIERLSVSNETFVPRFPIELNAIRVAVSRHSFGRMRTRRR